jgi:proteasome lid subunit RPN8/RPN11
MTLHVADVTPRTTIAAHVLNRVLEHARAAAPAECCGVLVGRLDAIAECVPVRNISTTATRYLLDPAEHITARRDARARGLDIVGFYHSHPRSGPEPSATDVAEASYAGHLYLIVGLAPAGHSGPNVAARLYRLVGGNFHEVPFVPVP